MANNERKPGESNKQYLNRIKAQKREQRIQEEIDKVKNQEDYGGELDASRLVEFTNTGTISQGTENKKSRKNNHRVDQKSVFGERKFKQNRSLAQRAWNDFTDATHLTSPPKFYDGWNRPLNAEVPLWESAQGQELERMGETAKDAGELVATGLAFSNPLTAGEVMAPLIAGSQAYWIGHGINDGAQRIDNIGEGVKNFVEDPSWQNAGAVAKEVPMLALDVVGALPVARTVIETGKNAIPAAQQAAQRIAGSVDDTITNATKQAVESGVVGVNELPAQLAARATSTPKVQEPLWNVGWAPAQTMNVRRAGELTEMYYPNRWDVVEEGANPFGVWLQGKFGTPRTNITNPGKGKRAAKARAKFANRPQYVGNVTFKKPIEVIGDVKDRSALSYNAERMGADGVIYNGFYDNGYNNNQGIFSFVKPNLSSSSGKPARIMWMGPTTGKTTYAKKDLSVVDIDPLTKGTRKEVAKKLGLDFRDPKVSESPEYQQAIVDMVNAWLKDPTNHGKTLVASTKHLLDPKYGIKFDNEPFIPDFETFVTRNQARGFRETPEQLRKWYDSILKIKPNIKIDNRFASEILNPSFKSETVLVSTNGKMVPRWQLPKGQRNQPHNPTATERIYSVLGRDSNVPTGGIDAHILAQNSNYHQNLGALYKFLQKHGVDTKNLTLADLKNLYGKRMDAIRKATNKNYNLALPDGNEALPRDWEVFGYDSEGLVGELSFTGPRKYHPGMDPERWKSYQQNRPGASIDMVHNATRSKRKRFYDPATGGWIQTEILNRTPINGVSQRMYDASIPVAQQTNNGRGLMSGEMYLQPQRSTAVMKHYPNKKIIKNNGEWHWENLDPTKVTTRDNPVYLLTQPSGRYNHIPTKSTLFFPSAIKDGQITTNINHGSIFLEDGGKIENPDH